MACETFMHVNLKEVPKSGSTFWRVNDWASGKLPLHKNGQRVLVGITPLTRKSKQVYQIAFSFRGVECREVIELPHSRPNAQYCSRLRGEILAKIARNDFKYADFFPTSKRAVLFGHAPVGTSSLKDVLETYRDRGEGHT